MYAFDAWLLCTPNPPTHIADFRGLDSSIILIYRSGILTSIEDFLEGLSRAMLVGRLGVLCTCVCSITNMAYSPPCSAQVLSPYDKCIHVVYIYIYIHTHTYACTNMCIYTYMHISTSLSLSIYIYIHIVHEFMVCYVMLCYGA